MTDTKGNLAIQIECEDTAETQRSIPELKSGIVARENTAITADLQADTAVQVIETIRINKVELFKPYMDDLTSAVKEHTEEFKLSLAKRMKLRNELLGWLDGSLQKNPNFPDILARMGFKIIGKVKAEEIALEPDSESEESCSLEFIDDTTGEVKNV